MPRGHRHEITHSLRAFNWYNWIWSTRISARTKRRPSEKNITKRSYATFSRVVPSLLLAGRPTDGGSSSDWATVNVTALPCFVCVCRTDALHRGPKNSPEGARLRHREKARVKFPDRHLLITARSSPLATCHWPSPPFSDERPHQERDKRLIAIYKTHSHQESILCGPKEPRVRWR